MPGAYDSVSGGFTLYQIGEGTISDSNNYGFDKALSCNIMDKGIYGSTVDSRVGFNCR